MNQNFKKSITDVRQSVVNLKFLFHVTSSYYLADVSFNIFFYFGYKILIERERKKRGRCKRRLFYFLLLIEKKSNLHNEQVVLNTAVAAAASVADQSVYLNIQRIK